MLNEKKAQAHLEAIQAQEAVLGLVLTYPRSVHQYSDLDDNTWTDDGIGAAWSVIRCMAEQGDIDPTVLISRLDEAGLSGTDWYMRLTENTPIPSNSEIYRQELRKKIAVFRALVACEAFCFDLGTSDTLEALESLRSEINGNSGSGRSLKAHSLSEVAQEALDQTLQDQAYIETGYFSLDSKLGGGLTPGSMTIVAAGPSCGKTALALNIMQGSTANGRPVRALYIGMEMGKAELFDRLCAYESGMPGQLVGRLRKNIASKDEAQRHYKAYGESVKSISKAGHRIKSDGLVSISEVRALVAMYAGEVDLVIVDYIQQMKPSAAKQSEMEKINEASWACKELAMRYSLPVVVLSQLNREGYKDGQRPTLASLRASGQLEQDADNVLLMWRAKEYDVSREDLTVFLAKNRAGPIATLGMRYDLMQRDCVKATKDLDNLATDATDEQPNLYCECTHQLNGDGLCPMCDIAAEVAE